MRCDPERDLWIPEFGDASSERFSPYSRLDLSLSFLADLGRGEPTVFFASLANAFERVIQHATSEREWFLLAISNVDQ